MTTYTRTWKHFQNLAPADQTTHTNRCASMIFAIKDKLIDSSVGWTVKSSCGYNGSSYAYSTSDNWADYTWVKRATSGAHSWIVLESPAHFPTTGKRMYLCLDYTSSSDNKVDMYLSTADYTGGSTSSRGTGSNENALGASGGEVNIASSTNADHRMHIHASTEGDLIIYSSKNGDGRAGWGMLFIACEDSQSGDLYPLIEYCYHGNYLTGGIGAFEDSNIAHRYSNMGHWSDGTRVSTTYYDYSQTAVWPNLPASSSSVGDYFDSLGDDISGKYMRFPLYLITNTYTLRAYRGRIYDIAATNCGAGVLQGTTEPAGGPVQSAVVGHLMIPADSTPQF